MTTGVEERDRALGRLEMTRQEYIAKARTAAVRHAKRHGTVTADDVRRLCPVPEGVDARVVGCVLQHGPFEAVGFGQTQVRTSHGRPVRRWRLDPRKGA